MFARGGFPLLHKPTRSFAVLGNNHLDKDAEVFTLISRIHSSKNIQ